MPRLKANVYGFKEISARTQASAIMAMRESIDVLTEAVKEEAPVGLTGNLRDSVQVAEIKEYGPHRIQVSIYADLELAPYYYAVVYGVREQRVGETGKIYGTGAAVWVGQWTMPSRDPNNFPRRAIDRAGPNFKHLLARNFVVRLKQKSL